jgi:serine protease inhibitor
MSPMHIVSGGDNSIVAVINAFGFQLLAQLIEQDVAKNVFASPPSIALALAMTYNGADGTTKEAMAATLGVQHMRLQAVNAANATLLATLADPDPHVHLAMAQALWGRQGLAFKTDFRQRCQDCYGAEIATLDFANPGVLSIIQRQNSGNCPPLRP